MSNPPFTIVDRSERNSPVQEINPMRCDHPRAYTSDKYPAHGTRYICTECGFGSGFPRDLE